MNKIKYALLLLLLQPNLVFALSEEVKTFYWQSIDLAIFAGIIISANLFFGNPLKEFWTNRWKSVERAIKSGNYAFAQAQERLKKAKENQISLQQNIVDLNNKITQDTEAEIKHLIEHAHQQAQSFISQAEVRADIERQTARKKAKNEMIQSIIQEATNRLKNINNYERDRSRRFQTIEALQSWYDTKKVEN